MAWHISFLSKILGEHRRFLEKSPCPNSFEIFLYNFQKPWCTRKSISKLTFLFLFFLESGPSSRAGQPHHIPVPPAPLAHWLISPAGQSSPTGSAGPASPTSILLLAPSRQRPPLGCWRTAAPGRLPVYPLSSLKWTPLMSLPLPSSLLPPHSWLKRPE
jgi:hypothetical protein